jgi:FtsZ-binding cell division protein ZapB
MEWVLSFFRRKRAYVPAAEKLEGLSREEIKIRSEALMQEKIKLQAEVNQLYEQYVLLKDEHAGWTARVETFYVKRSFHVIPFLLLLFYYMIQCVSNGVPFTYYFTLFFLFWRSVYLKVGSVRNIMLVVIVIGTFFFRLIPSGGGE